VKKIEAFFRKERLDVVVGALEQAGYPGISISDALGHGKQRGEAKDWHGQFKAMTFQPKVRIEIVVHDHDLNRLLATIADAARKGEFGDGKIFVTDVVDALRIRTNQRGDVALD
jgi:nitrogen regulatory protein P-II 1